MFPLIIFNIVGLKLNLKQIILKKNYMLVKKCELVKKNLRCGWRVMQAYSSEM